jgi:hypothetical protein
VANRDHWRVQISQDANCSQKQAKQLALSILFGGSYTSWLKENNTELPRESVALKMVDGLQREMRRYVPWWDKTHGAAVRVSDLCSDKELRAKGTSPAFRRISLFYQDLETKVTLVAKRVLESKGVAVRVLCHDGLIASLDVDGGYSLDADADGHCSSDDARVGDGGGVIERGAAGEAYVRSSSSRWRQSQASPSSSTCSSSGRQMRSALRQRTTPSSGTCRTAPSPST